MGQKFLPSFFVFIEDNPVTLMQWRPDRDWTEGWGETHSSYTALLPPPWWIIIIKSCENHPSQQECE